MSLENKDIDASKKFQYEIKEKSIKYLANSIYGIIGSKSSRFYSRSIASLIAQQGRKALMIAYEK